MRPAALTTRTSSSTFCSVSVRAPAAVKDLLPHHRALDVVGAEVQRHLREREPHHDPVGLHVRDVVEQQARNGDGLEVVARRGVTPAATLEDGVLGVEGERDEGQEAAGLVLQVAQAQQVVDPLLVRLHVAVEHRAVGRDAEPVGGAVGVEPEVGMLLARGNQTAHAVGEHLGTASGQGAEPGVAQPPEHLLVREPESVVMWWISLAVKSFRWTSGSASCSRSTIST